jgi:glycosyltransferase involved in cell wall biosynthesis
MKNQCKGFPLYTEHKIIKNINEFPDCDIVIATDYRSVESTIKIPKNKCKFKLHYIRAWETWNFSENYIINNILKSPLIKIVNSIGLQNKLKKYDIESFLIRPGNDLNNFKLLNIRDNKKIVLGGLYHTKHLTKKSDMIIKIAKKIKSEYNNVELHMFGTPNNPNNSIIDKYIKQPNIKEKNEFYNNIDIWLSTSELEGLHICPAEAMLCGCVVVGNESELSGTHDYLIDNVTGLVSRLKSNDFIDKIKHLIQNPKLMETLSEAGRNKIIELGNRKENMIKFVELMENLIGKK